VLRLILNFSLNKLFGSDESKSLLLLLLKLKTRLSKQLTNNFCRYMINL
jgi:hypothetical protein